MAEHKFTEGYPVYTCRECGEHFDKHEEFRREGKADSAKPHVFQRQWQLDAMRRIAEQHPASYAARDVLVLLSDLEAMRADLKATQEHLDLCKTARDSKDAELDRLRKALELAYEAMAGNDPFSITKWSDAVKACESALNPQSIEAHNG